MSNVIQTYNAPHSIGPYSQAIKAGDFLFVSGQIAVNPADGTMVQTDIASETTQVVQNIAAILEAAGADWDNVVKSTVYLTDMAFFKEMNGAYEDAFNNTYPARETVAVKALPNNANVEISVVAYIPKKRDEQS